MGHALKLLHPKDNDLTSGKHTFIGNRMGYENYPSVYSIMNQGFSNSNENYLTAAKPQAHDRINLISKWENHVNCEH